MKTKPGRIALIGAVIIALALLLAGLFGGGEDEAQGGQAPAPVLTVALTRAEPSMLPIRVPATGNVVAWQEASVGAEGEGLRLTEVRVNVGDTVRRGQVLATFYADLVEAELAEARATVAQIQAEVLDAEANARRAQALDGSGAMSAQQVSQYLAAAKAVRARLAGARATEQRHRLRLAQTRVLAPSDGVVTARTATVGAVVPGGQELFRMIKDGRLEWRAIVAARDLDKLEPGQRAVIAPHGRAPVQGRLRIVAPAIDLQTHNGMAYVDLPSDGFKAGTFVRGYVEIGDGPVLTVPQSAVLLRDGFSYVMRVGPASNVLMSKVAVGRRIGDRIEIVSGLAPSQDVIASGLGFLSEGDTVRVVQGTAARDAGARSARRQGRANAQAAARSGP